MVADSVLSGLPKCGSLILKIDGGYIMTISKLALVATAVLGLGATTVQAQETVDWNGFYAGIFGGMASGNTKVEFRGPTVPPGASADTDLSGLFGGVAVGFNYQLPQGLVVGLEADIAKTDISGAGDLLGPTFPINGEVSSTASLRGRVGYAVDRFLPFATAGLAIAHTNQGFPFVGPALAPAFSLQDGNLYGWTVGAGVEYAVTDAISIKAEYRYSQYDGSNSASILGGGPDDSIASSFKTHDVRLGVNYRF